MSTPLSCNFCFTNDIALALSASESEIWFSGFDGKARRVSARAQA